MVTTNNSLLCSASVKRPGNDCPWVVEEWCASGSRLRWALLNVEVLLTRTCCSLPNQCRNLVTAVDEDGEGRVVTERPVYKFNKEW